MRIAVVLALACLVGCAQQSSSLHAPCASASECPAGYVCETYGFSMDTTCELPCPDLIDDPCIGLQGAGRGEGHCTAALGLCDVRCDFDADCPAPLHCGGAGADCIR